MVLIFFTVDRRAKAPVHNTEEIQAPSADETLREDPESEHAWQIPFFVERQLTQPFEHLQIWFAADFLK